MIALVNALIQRSIRLITIKQNPDIQQQDMNSKIIITLFSLFSELERDLISLRTKEALSAKRAQGQGGRVARSLKYSPKKSSVRTRTIGRQSSRTKRSNFGVGTRLLSVTKVTVFIAR